MYEPAAQPQRLNTHWRQLPVNRRAAAVTTTLHLGFVEGSIRNGARLAGPGV